MAGDDRYDALLLKASGEQSDQHDEAFNEVWGDLEKGFFESFGRGREEAQRKRRQKPFRDIETTRRLRELRGGPTREITGEDTPFPEPEKVDPVVEEEPFVPADEGESTYREVISPPVEEEVEPEPEEEPEPEPEPEEEPEPEPEPPKKKKAKEKVKTEQDVEEKAKEAGRQALEEEPPKEEPTEEIGGYSTEDLVAGIPRSALNLDDKAMESLLSHLNVKTPPEEPNNKDDDGDGIKDNETTDGDPEMPKRVRQVTDDGRIIGSKITNKKAQGLIDNKGATWDGKVLRLNREPTDKEKKMNPSRYDEESGKSVPFETVDDLVEADEKEKEEPPKDEPPKKDEPYLGEDLEDAHTIEEIMEMPDILEDPEEAEKTGFPSLFPSNANKLYWGIKEEADQGNYHAAKHLFNQFDKYIAEELNVDYDEETQEIRDMYDRAKSMKDSMVGQPIDPSDSDYEAVCNQCSGSGCNMCDPRTPADQEGVWSCDSKEFVDGKWQKCDWEGTHDQLAEGDEALVCPKCSSGLLLHNGEITYRPPPEKIDWDKHNKEAAERAEEQQRQFKESRTPSQEFYELGDDDVSGTPTISPSHLMQMLGMMRKVKTPKHKDDVEMDVFWNDKGEPVGLMANDPAKSMQMTVGDVDRSRHRFTGLDANKIYEWYKGALGKQPKSRPQLSTGYQQWKNAPASHMEWNVDQAWDMPEDVPGFADMSRKEQSDYLETIAELNPKGKFYPLPNQIFTEDGKPNIRKVPHPATIPGSPEQPFTLTNIPDEAKTQIGFGPDFKHRYELRDIPLTGKRRSAYNLPSQPRWTTFATTPKDFKQLLPSKKDLIEGQMANIGLSQYNPALLELVSKLPVEAMSMDYPGMKLRGDEGYGEDYRGVPLHIRSQSSEGLPVSLTIAPRTRDEGDPEPFMVRRSQDDYSLLPQSLQMEKMADVGSGNDMSLLPAGWGDGQ